jgi:hypothetical protein
VRQRSKSAVHQFGQIRGAKRCRCIGQILPVLNLKDYGGIGGLKNYIGAQPGRLTIPAFCMTVIQLKRCAKRTDRFGKV